MKYSLTGITREVERKPQRTRGKHANWNIHTGKDANGKHCIQNGLVRERKHARVRERRHGWYSLLERGSNVYSSPPRYSLLSSWRSKRSWANAQLSTQTLYHPQRYFCPLEWVRYERNISVGKKGNKRKRTERRVERRSKTERKCMGLCRTVI